MPRSPRTATGQFSRGTSGNPAGRPPTRRADSADTALVPTAPAGSDVVRLVSGGPHLAVLRRFEDVTGVRMVDVGWFTKAGEYRTVTLPTFALMPMA